MRYDRTRGISYWSKNYRTGLETTDVDALNRVYPFYDPIDSLPSAGQAWWRKNCRRSRDTALSAGYVSVTPSSGDGAIPDQYGVGADSGEDSVLTPDGSSVLLPSIGLADNTSGSLRNSHGCAEI